MMITKPQISINDFDYNPLFHTHENIYIFNNVLK